MASSTEAPQAIYNEFDFHNGSGDDILDTCRWPDPKPQGLYCPPDRDTFQCWPASPPNTTVYGPCPRQFGFNSSVVLAHRTCTAEGYWDQGNWTDYSACIDLLKQPKDTEDDIRFAEVLRDIYFITSTISLAFLILTLFIFSYFKSLQCSRISIHKNLVLSFIFRFILIIIMFEPYISLREQTYRDVDWLCKVFTVLRKFTIMANFSWMFVEGLFLHNRLAVSVFSTEAPFGLFYVIGWGIPAIITTTWAVLMHFFYDESCWQQHNQSPLIFIIYAPILITLVINCAFLVNIIRILITKLRAHNTIETARIRKTIKATVVLLPLLGIINLLFLLKPEAKQGSLMEAYRVINAVLPACQGIFVALLYCFMNSELRKRCSCFTNSVFNIINSTSLHADDSAKVRSVIKKKWYRFRLSRSMSSRGRRRTSRTSSYFLSQSERWPCCVQWQDDVQDASIQEVSMLNKQKQELSQRVECLR